MSASTGPILAAGGITLANRVIFNERPMDWRIVLATGLSATMLSLAETIVGPDLPRGIAVAALVALVFTRVDRTVPSPAESALTWFYGS